MSHAPVQPPARAERLARAVRAIASRRPAEAPTPRDPGVRLDAIEREVQEMRTRVNALLFAVIAAGIADMVARMALR